MKGVGRLLQVSRTTSLWLGSRQPSCRPRGSLATCWQGPSACTSPAWWSWPKSSRPAWSNTLPRRQRQQTLQARRRLNGWPSYFLSSFFFLFLYFKTTYYVKDCAGNQIEGCPYVCVSVTLPGDACFSKTTSSIIVKYKQSLCCHARYVLATPCGDSVSLLVLTGKGNHITSVLWHGKLFVSFPHLLSILLFIKLVLQEKSIPAHGSAQTLKVPLLTEGRGLFFVSASYIQKRYLACTCLNGKFLFCGPGADQRVGETGNGGQNHGAAAWGLAQRPHSHGASAGALLQGQLDAQVWLGQDPPRRLPHSRWRHGVCGLK